MGDESRVEMTLFLILFIFFSLLRQSSLLIEWQSRRLVMLKPSWCPGAL